MSAARTSQHQRQAPVLVLRSSLLCLLGVASLFAALWALAAPARGELTARGDLLARFAGGIAPDALPRQGDAPIAVSVRSAVRTFSGDVPPALQTITIALNSAGRLDTRGLPQCRQAEIETATSSQAMSICGAALLGSGSYSADLAFPEQAVFASRGRVLAFNAVVGGRPAILAHVFGSEPALTSRVILFHIHRGPGTFGTVLTGAMPAEANGYGSVTSIALRLFRKYVYRDAHRSYISAGCPAPAGFTSAVFPFAKVVMSFTGGRVLASTLTRTCKVR